MNKIIQTLILSYYFQMLLFTHDLRDSKIHHRKINYRLEELHNDQIIITKTLGSSKKDFTPIPGQCVKQLHSVNKHYVHYPSH